MKYLRTSAGARCIYYDADEPKNEATDLAARSRNVDKLWSFLPGSLAEAQSVRHFFEKTGQKSPSPKARKPRKVFSKKPSNRSPPCCIWRRTVFRGYARHDRRAGFEVAENPMARAGLVLANGNRAWSGEKTTDGQEDGILTALEISHLDLSGT